MEEKELIQEESHPVEQLTEDVNQEVNEADQVQEPTDERERNFARLREARERAERERDEYKRKAEDLERQYSQQYSGGYQSQNLRQQQNNYTEQDQAYQRKLEQEYERLNDDDIVEGRHFTRVQQELKQLRQKQQEQEVISQAQRSMGALRTRYPDFDKIVSENNVARLKERYPSIARSLASGTDIEAIGESAYEVIKKFGIHEEDVHLEQKAQVQHNVSKPRPMGSTSPLAQANQYDNKRYSKEELDQARREMLDSMRGR